jgi:hypothetical protein
MTYSIPNLHPDWITHRLPTAADADFDGDVWLPEVPKALPGDCSENSWQHWSIVVPGQPWWSEEAAANPAPPATSPAPAPAPTRKVVQIAVAPNTPEKKTTLYALCSDSSIWWISDCSAFWTQIPPVPQPEAAP